MSSSERQLTPDLEKPTVHRIETSNGGAIVHLGPYSFRRDELMDAFGGQLNPGIHATPPIRIGNPAAMGLAAFAFCAFVVSLIHLQTRGVTNQAILISACLFYGGAIELIAGILCFLTDNTFAGTAFGCFGGFWLSYGGILSDKFDIKSSYKTEAEFNSALGFFLVGWVFFAFALWICTFKATWPFFSLFFLLVVWITVLAIGVFTAKANVVKAAGVLGLLASFNSLYLMWAGIANKENSYFQALPLYMPHAPRV